MATIIAGCVFGADAHATAEPSSIRPRPSVTQRGVFRKVEISFQLPGLTGNPFDIILNDVRVSIRRPDGRTVRIPAFFDGDSTWRIRYTPDAAGRHAVAGVTHNGATIHPAGLSPTAFLVQGPPKPGFVRRDPKAKDRFELDDGSGYYPIGHNAAWGDGKAITIPGVLAKMGKAGENWTRIWMCHWDGKNLDWVPDKSIPLGRLDLGVARQWDRIVSAAERSGVRFQMVLQHHGPYSTDTDSNWDENPWNARNGGFLSSPREFFSSPRAMALTRAKYRYIVARWGYSPSVMAWELFNEVQLTDAVRDGHQAAVSAWHNAMAGFIKEQDPYHHLVTSSFRMDPRELGDRLDYWQPHAYVADPLAAISGLNGLGLDRPVFLGEIGPQGDLSRADATFLRRILWASLMSESAGTAQFWAWDVVERKNLYPVFTPVAGFIRWSGLDQQGGFKALPARVDADGEGALTFAPGAEWEAAEKTEFTVAPSGEVSGLSGLPRFLQGEAHRAMFSEVAFHVDFTEPGTFAVTIGEAAKAGARVVLSLDSEPIERREFPPAETDRRVAATLRIPVPAGRHTVRVANGGADWVTLDQFTLEPYGSRFRTLAKGNGVVSVVWIESRVALSEPASGRLAIPGMAHGIYRVRWWDPSAGRPLAEQTAVVAADGILSVSMPALSRDIAAVIQPTTHP